MKRKLLCFIALLLCAILIASLAWAGRLRRGGGVAAPAGDLEIVAYFNCNSATTGQALQKGTGTVTIGASVTTIAGQVSNGLDNNNTSYSAGRVLIPAANVDYSIGTVGFWIYLNEADYGEIVASATNNAAFQLARAYSNVYQFSFRGGSTIDLTIAPGGWNFVEVSWDYANTRASGRVNGGSWTAVANCNGATVPSGDFQFLVGPTGQVVDCVGDQLIISNVYQKDIYSVRNNTSF